MLLRVVSSPWIGATSSSKMFVPACSIGAGICTIWPIGAVSVRERFAVTMNGQRRGLSRIGAVEDAHGDRLVFADDAEARRLDEFDPPIPLAGVAGDEDMQRRAKSERRDRGGNVVSDSVGDDDRSADAFRRRVAQRRPQRREHLRALVVRIVARGFDEMRFDVVERAESLFQLGAGLGGLAFAVPDTIAPRPIEDDRDDVLQRSAILALQSRVEQP